MINCKTENETNSLVWDEISDGSVGGLCENVFEKWAKLKLCENRFKFPCQI